ncbi:Eco57I restriction-modification methylase domain-containing protein [Candidatus Oscillochloris fontis]|uniref:Eco57I restriction-modification methylase domain-containing protein n=1 Tax=Candidatus Oscillochloris fontis TaxID=2496868 RepID=UPI00101C879A|nr:N-6 DNA methylase [Candidatus Oscillochloris fontis]
MAALTLGVFALRLINAFRSWNDPTHGSANTYFSGNLARHGGDELRLRASLIKDHLLTQGFGYDPAAIEIEAADRSDVVLYAGSRSDRRPVAIVETKKSGFGHLLATRLATGETPPQQLARYVRLRGLYLGVLTNGNIWHFFDLGVSLQPRATITLTELDALLAGSTTPAQADAALAAHPSLANALLIAQDMLDATKWTTVDGYLAELNDVGQFHSIALTTPEARSGLVQQIAQRLGLLRETISAQFALLYQDLTTYTQLCSQISATDPRLYADRVVDEIALLVGQVTEPDLRDALLTLVHDLVAEFEATGDADWFYATYIVRAQSVLAYQQSVLPGMAVPVSSSPVAIPKPDTLLALLSTHFTYITALGESYAASVRLQRAYSEWQRRVRGVYADPAREFCLQTGYIHFVRLFFVRVCEDYGLIQRRISDGPFSQFDAYRRALLAGVRDVYQRLLHETFERAANVYHNFFSRADLYDWFQLDERSILGILAALNRYNFQQLDFDLLGHIYNEGYIEEQRRSEHGQFYTPHAVVTYMVDSLNLFPVRHASDTHPLTTEERAAINLSVIDVSCGSGSFLVEIAARKAAILHVMVQQALLQPSEAIEYLVDTLAGIDISPFACYLAEINLMMRCMPFLRDTTSGSLIAAHSISRIHIYCGDTLEPTRRELVEYHLGHNASALGASVPIVEPVRLSDEERRLQSMKDRKATPGRLMQGKQGFDVVIGNPPYVKANESQETSTYRHQIRSWGIYPVRDKWDLFVPFVYRNLGFLAENGWMILITTNAIETEGYAKPLRADLSRYWLEQIDFFPRLKLFGNDVGVMSTIFKLQKRAALNPSLRRRTHTAITCTSYTEAPINQALGPEVLFRANYMAPPPELHTCCVPLCAIAYIGTGLEAHSHEREDTIIHGQRVKAFDLDDSFRISIDGLSSGEATYFTDRGVLGAEVQAYYLTRQRYVAYDYMKAKMRRPRIPELFRTPKKLLLGETSGGYYDTDQLFANHSVQVVVPWHALNVDERGVKKVRNNSMAISGYTDLETIAKLFDLRYILAVINSDYMRRYLLSNQAQGTREGRIYPDVWKQMPVKVIDPSQQARIGALVEHIQALQHTLQSAPNAQDVYATWQQDGKLTGKISDFIIDGSLNTFGALNETRKSRYLRDAQQVTLFNQTGISVNDSANIPILDYFCWYCNEIDPGIRGYPWSHLRSSIPVPRNLSEIEALLSAIEAIGSTREGIIAAIGTQRNEIETAVVEAYTNECAETLWLTIQRLEATRADDED